MLCITSLLLIQNRLCGAPAEDPGTKAEPAQPDGVVNLSRAEAKQAWLAEGSDLEKAARQARRERLAKVTLVENAILVFKVRVYAECLQRAAFKHTLSEAAVLNT